MSRELPGARKTHSLKSTSSLMHWLRQAPWGEHSLLVYNTTDEFLKVIVTYVVAGLSQNQACLWVVSAVPLQEAKEALRQEVGSLSPYIRKKQLLMVGHQDWYLAGGSFDDGKVLKQWLEKEEEALRRGFAGLRIAGDAAWAKKSAFPRLLKYEAKVTSTFDSRKVVALCAYPAEHLSLGGLVDITNMHHILIAKEGRAFRPTRRISPIEGKLRQAEEALRNYEFVFESAHDAVFFKDLESRYTMVNDKTLEIFGLSREEVIGKNDYEIMPNKKEARKNIEDDQIVFKTGKPTEITKHMTGADGKEYWFEAIKVPQFDSNGKAIGLVGIARDITGRKRSEDARRESEERYRALFELAAEGILIADSKTREFKYANPAICKMLGYSEEELKGMGVSDIHPKEALSHVISEFEAQVRGEKTLAEDIPCLRKDGKIIYADINTSKVSIDGRECAIGFFRDITQHKAADERIKQRSKELAALNTVASSISGSLDLKEVAKRSLEAVFKAVQLDIGAMYVLDEAQQVLRLVTYRGFSRIALREAKEIEVGSGIVGRAVAKREVLLGKDLSKCPGVKHSQGAKKSNNDSVAAVPLVSKRSVRGVMIVGARARHEFTPDELRLLKAIGGQVGMAVENARLFRKTEVQRDGASALREIGEAIARTLDLEKVLQLITEHGTALLEGDGGTTALLTPEKGSLEIVAACGKQKSLLGKPLPLDGSLCGWVARHRKPQIVHDAFADPRFLKKYAKRGRVRNCIAAPLMLRGKVIGTLFVQNQKGESRGFTSGDLELLLAFADQAAVAIDNARLFQEAEQSVEQLRALSARLTEVQDEERSRIVNYLHSNLVQTLTAAKTNLGLVSRQPKKDPVQLRKSLTSVILMIDEAIKETRGLMFDLRTPMLDDLGLIAAVRWYAGVFLKRTGVKVEIKADDFPKDLSHTRRLMLFHIIQELLTNVAKHAKVSRAKLTVRRRKGMDVIVVADSGVGFDPESPRPSRAAMTGLGLVAIREMVSRSKGYLGVDSVPGRGTIVTVRIPVEEPSGQG